MEYSNSIIVDIDGTLANIDHRRHYVKGCRKDWSEFKKKYIEDQANKWCVCLIEAMYKQGLNLLFVTGREEAYRKGTLEQIENWVCVHYSKVFLFMRSDGDFRSDVEVKKEMYNTHIKEKFKVLFCVDDSEVIVNLWRSLGLVCLDCAGYQR